MTWAEHPACRLAQTEGSKDHGVIAIIMLHNQLAHVSNLYRNVVKVANTRRKWIMFPLEFK